ncbi:ABC-2 transporter permease [Bacillus kwashiorkori]|uniref:ABC-2 transporter permease n=1 Tax=Bacillus kwashiorkori TaxID=1522318 RepID=UPI0007852961|nr:ABC-2 transporter permease [Bacillus kwashiorkori]
MLNLIRKDFLLQKNILLIMLTLLFVSINFATSAIWVGILFSIAIVMQCFSADEKSPIHLLLNSLPYSRKEIVSSKYIGACVFVILVLVTIFIGHLIIHKEIFPWRNMLFITNIVLIFISFAFPFSYMFNSHYLLIASGVLFVLYLMLINLFLPNLNDMIREISGLVLALDNDQSYLIVSLGVLIIYFFSWVLSIRIYSKKIF